MCREVSDIEDDDKGDVCGGGEGDYLDKVNERKEVSAEEQSYIYYGGEGYNDQCERGLNVEDDVSVDDKLGDMYYGSFDCDDGICKKSKGKRKKSIIFDSDEDESEGDGSDEIIIVNEDEDEGYSTTKKYKGDYSAGEGSSYDAGSYDAGKGCSYDADREYSCSYGDEDTSGPSGISEDSVFNVCAVSVL